MEVGSADLTDWIQLVKSTKDLSRRATIGIVGKYVALPDSYLSVVEALRHAGGFALGCAIDLRWVDAEKLETDGYDCLENLDGIIVPGGFGGRAVWKERFARCSMRGNMIFRFSESPWACSARSWSSPATWLIFPMREASNSGGKIPAGN